MAQWEVTITGHATQTFVIDAPDKGKAVSWAQSLFNIRDFGRDLMARTSYWQEINKVDKIRDSVQLVVGEDRKEGLE